MTRTMLPPKRHGSHNSSASPSGCSGCGTKASPGIRKAPPHLTTMRAGIDSNGKVVAWDYNGRMLNGTQRAAGRVDPWGTLIGQAMGYKPR